MSSKKNKNIKWQTARAIKKNKKPFKGEQNFYNNDKLKEEREKLFENKRTQNNTVNNEIEIYNHTQDVATPQNKLAILKNRSPNTMEQFYQKMQEQGQLNSDFIYPKPQNYTTQPVFKNPNINPNYPRQNPQILPKRSGFNFLSFIYTLFGVSLFLASLAFWLWIVQPSVLEKITSHYTDKNGYILNERTQAIKQVEKIDKIVEAGKTDVQNIKNMGCQNNNVELNIKKFEQERYKIIPQNQPVVSGFKEEQIDKMYLDYVVDLNVLVEDHLVIQDMGMMARDIQSLNNLSVNCSKIIQKYRDLENPEFTQNICSDLKMGVSRFGVANVFSLNKICNSDLSKEKFLEEIDQFIISSADNIVSNKESDVLEKIDELTKKTEFKINEYYNKKINFPDNLYLLKVK